MGAAETQFSWRENSHGLPWPCSLPTVPQDPRTELSRAPEPSQKHSSTHRELHFPRGFPSRCFCLRAQEKQLCLLPLPFHNYRTNVSLRNCGRSQRTIPHCNGAAQEGNSSSWREHRTSAGSLSATVCTILMWKIIYWLESILA